MSKVGLYRLGSSRLPAVIIARSGIALVFPNRLEPHSGQKPRLSVLPLSAFLSWDFTAPVTSSAAAGNPMSGSYAPPLAFWQSRQWQFPMKNGSAEHS